MVCYQRLWKLLIDKHMSRTDLRLASGITTSALAQLGRDEYVSLKTIEKICTALDCEISDVVELRRG